MKIATALSALVILAASPAISQDLTVYGGAALVYDMELDNAAGENTLAFQPYVEGEVNHFYGGLWLSIANDNVANEVDIYFGYRNETPTGMTYDIGYTRYLYPNDGGDCCGEVALALSAPVSDALTLNIDAALDPEISEGSASVGADYALGDKFSVGAAIGVADFGGAQEWELGATYSLTDQAAVDLHYYDGSDYTPYLELTLSYDTTLFSR